MLKNGMLNICKELKLLGCRCPASCEREHLDTIVGHIYDKYFRAIVSGACTKPTAEEQERFRRLLDVKTNQDEEFRPCAEDIWIFGYGSLVWKADFPYIDRRRGYISGYQRRFYQHSIDHRGTYAKPGRVVTLLPTHNEADRVYGIAYRIAAQQKSEVLRHLDYREKNGYERCTLQFHEFPETLNASFEIIMYIATQANESYAGSVWQVERIAEQIFTSAGPSGPNREYLFNLANAMRTLFPGVDDQHLYELERAVLQRIEDDEVALLESALKKSIVEFLLRLECGAADAGAGEPNNVQHQDISASDKLAEERNGTSQQTDSEQFEVLRSCCSMPGWRETLLTKELRAKGGAS